MNIISDFLDLSFLVYLISRNHGELVDILAWIASIDNFEQRELAIKYIRTLPLHQAKATLEKKLPLLKKSSSSVASIPVIWFPSNATFKERWRTQYSWWVTIWLRIHFADALVKYDAAYMKKSTILAIKVQKFHDAHLPILQQMGLNLKLDSEFDKSILESIISLGPSLYDQDRHQWKIDRLRIQRRNLPLELLELVFFDYTWRVELVIKKQITLEKVHYDPLGLWNPSTYTNKANYQIYIACCIILEQCRVLHPSTTNVKVADALYFYYVCFMDLFDHCLREGQFSDVYLLTVTNHGISPWEYFYPDDTRAFCSWDLPCVFFVLARIPLWGAQQEEFSLVHKLLQKSLPFSGQCRGIVQLVVTKLQQEPQFVSLMSAVCWCALADTYPDGKMRVFDMRRLLRAHEICQPENLLEALGRLNQRSKLPDSKRERKTFDKETNRNCDVLLVALRMWILQMVKGNQHYINAASECMDWNTFAQHTRERHNLLKQCNIFTADAFEEARSTLTVSNNAPIYRYRDGTIVQLIATHLTKALQNHLYNEVQDIRRDLAKCQNINDENTFKVFLRELPRGIHKWIQNEIDQNLEWYVLLDILQSKMTQFLCLSEKPLDKDVKQRILNVILRIPHDQWLTRKTLCLFTLPELGGLSMKAVFIIQRLLDIYIQSGKPEEFAQAIGNLDTLQFKYINWIFYIMSILHDIYIVPMDRDSTRAVEQAMKRVRYPLYEDQELSPYAYDVFLTICCQYINTLDGHGNYGHNPIAYDMERQVFVCAKKQKNNTSAMDADLMKFEYYAKQATQRKTARDKRKAFRSIPCQGQEVIRINLRGYDLYYGINRYRFCTQCACLFICQPYHWSGSTTGMARCDNCITLEKMLVPHKVCSYCEGTLGLRPLTLVDTEAHKIQEVYFCKKHYKHAIPYAQLSDLSQILKKIGFRVRFQQRRNATQPH